MLQIAIIVFREIVEIAMIIGILSAVTKDLVGRTKWIISGLSLGVVASVVVALFADLISSSMNDNGQDIVNGAILLIASSLVIWTVIWMQKHARSISGELKTVSNEIRSGKKPLYFLAIVAFLNMLREGSEISLFTYSYYISGTSLFDVICGLLIGVLLGVVVGVVIYLGMLKIFGRYFLMATSWIMIFLACGLIAQACGFWIDAKLIAPLGNPIWDSSAILSQASWFGKFLHIFFGYIDQPAGIQVIAYFATLAAVGGVVGKLRIKN